MNERQSDLVEEWADVSARAAAASGAERRGARGVAAGGVRPIAGWSIGTLAVAVAVVIAGLSLRPSAVEPGASGPPGPVQAATDDGVFRLGLATPHAVYAPGDAIEPIATVTYLGPDAEVRMSHAAQAIGFRIEEVGGERATGGGTRLPCRSTHLLKGEPIAQPFLKHGSPDEVFDQAWYEDPVLRLPPGTWRVVAMLNSTVGEDCRGEAHRLEVANVIRVVDGLPSSVATIAASPGAATMPPRPSVVTPPSPSPEPAASAPSEGPVAGVTDDGMFRLELTTPSGIYSPDDAIGPVARLTHVGSGAAVTFGHSDPAVTFTIEQVGGEGRQMTSGADDVCLSTTLRRAEASTIPFHKSGQIDLGFDLAWFQDPVLRLPAGTWRIRVRLEAYVPECGLDAAVHEPTVENILIVR